MHHWIRSMYTFVSFAEFERWKFPGYYFLVFRFLIKKIQFFFFRFFVFFFFFLVPKTSKQDDVKNDQQSLSSCFDGNETA